MNATEIVHYTVNLVRHRIFSNVQFIYDIFWLAFKLARVAIRSLVVLPVGLVLDVCGDLLRFGLTLSCILIVVTLISLIKSLKPRYNFYHDSASNDTTISNDANDRSGSKSATRRRDEIFSPSTVRTKSACSGWPIKRYIETKFPFALRLWSRLRTESNDVNRMCSPALSVPDIESTYKRLSWSHTQVDIESVNWLNQTFRTLWPSIKTLLNIFVFNDLLKPKRAGNKVLANESRKLSRKQPKLSVYISSRRKLDLIRQIEANVLSRYQNFIDRSLFRTTIYLLKLVIIYMKQFFIDYVSYLFKKGKRVPSLSKAEKKFEINLEKVLSVKKRLENVVEKRSGGTKSWAGFDISAESRRKRENLKYRRERRVKSAPTFRAKTRMLAQGLLGPRGMVKLRERRLKLADRFRKAYEKSKEKNELIIERIQLGNSIPMVNGLKYIDEQNDLMIDPVRTSRHLVGSDERNMRFVSELSYASDKNFQIKLSLPSILGQVRLVNLKVQIRCYLTLNHTINGLNRDLKIFDTPDDVLFPSINYVQLSLVDVPSFDWKLDRPNRRRSPDSNKQRRPLAMKRVSNYMSTLFDPVDVINHSYFKYIVHSIVYVGLKWFQPFDIKIGPHLYLKTIC